MGSRTAKSVAGICCFRRPREWFSLGTEYLLLLLRISSQWTRQIVEPSWSSAALANSLDRKYILPAHLRLLLLAFPWLAFTPTESHNQTNATRRTAWKKIALAERQRARNYLIFRCGCKHETPGCKRLKVKSRINFATRLIFLRPSHANFDLLFSNFAVRDVILFTLDFNTQPEMRVNRKLKVILIRSAFCRGVAKPYTSLLPLPPLLWQDMCEIWGACGKIRSHNFPNLHFLISWQYCYTKLLFLN